MAPTIFRATAAPTSTSAFSASRQTVTRPTFEDVAIIYMASISNWVRMWCGRGAGHSVRGLNWSSGRVVPVLPRRRGSLLIASGGPVTGQAD
jgi:hypothetical protein